MSTLEKILGLIAVLVIGLIFIVFLTLGTAHLYRWLQKGVSSNRAFPRSPQGGALSEDRQRALNVGAILSGSNRDYCDSLQTGKKGDKDAIAEFMVRDWAVTSSEEALERLEELKFNGHRQINGCVLKNAGELLVSGIRPFMESRAVYERTGFPLLDRRVLLEYPREAALAERHIGLLDELVNAPSPEDVKGYQTLFGDARTFSRCIRIFRQFYENCLVYAGRLVNLEQALPLLRREGYLGADLSELERIDTAAWDMGRMVNIARYSYDLGYISKSLAWGYLSFAAREAAARYEDWAAFAQAYIIGRALWGGQKRNLYATMSTVRRLKTEQKSPWALVPLH